MQPDFRAENRGRDNEEDNARGNGYFCVEFAFDRTDRIVTIKLNILGALRLV